MSDNSTTHKLTLEHYQTPKQFYFLYLQLFLDTKCITFAEFPIGFCRPHRVPRFVTLCEQFQRCCV